MSERWTLRRDLDGYWYWQNSNGQKSPGFCVRELARRWKRCLRLRPERKEHTFCKDCGTETKSGQGSARCPDCWESRCR